METTNQIPETGYLRLKQVLRFIPVSKSTWWAGIKTGRFPSPYKIGSHITLWRVQDIKDCIANLPKQQ